jgi:LacI family transcriptional regulator
MLALSSKFTDQITDILRDDIPKISVETVYDGVPTVISDSKMGARQALEHLYMLGHKKIAHIMAPLDTIAGKERLQAYKDFLESNGLEFNPKYCVEASQYSKSAGAEAVNTLLQQCWDEFPTAIYAAYDDYAFAAKEILSEKGFRVPEDISIVGNDDLPISGYLNPGITTIRQNRDEIGAQAAKILVNAIEKDIKESSKVVRIPTKLIVRQTTFRNIENKDANLNAMDWGKKDGN